MSDELNSKVDKTIAENFVVVFSKSYCPYCSSTKKILEDKNVKYVAWELDQMGEDGPAVQNYLVEKTNQRTVPNIFIKQQHIGGNDKLRELKDSGELDKLLTS
ncbi:3411_t:CDS:2 [Scutellospora calospora]|uniref:3411_t:CDS:1 n=1 Tax=Scutellospora calospora TaxID=85575 RepID=A0ACA9MNP2_9GLOM|nr:3411_t:CDS:2 [Scutellospora calospora]